MTSLFNTKHVSLGVKPAVFNAFIDESDENLGKYLTDKISKEKYLKTLAKDYLKIRSKILDFKIFYPKDVMYLNNQLSGLEIYVLESFIKIVDKKDIKPSYSFSLNIGGSLSRGDFTPHSDIDHMIIAHERNNSIQINSALFNLLNEFKFHLATESIINTDNTFANFIIPENEHLEIFEKWQIKDFINVTNLDSTKKSFYKSAMIDFRPIYGERSLLERFKELYSKQTSISIEQYLSHLTFSFNKKFTTLDELTKMQSPFPKIGIKELLRLYQFFVYFTKSYLIGKFRANSTAYIDWINLLVEKNILTKHESDLFEDYFKFVLSVRTILEKHIRGKTKTISETDYKILSKYLKRPAETIIRILGEATRFIVQLNEKYRESFFGSDFI